MTILILGCGAVGKLVAEKELTRGHRVVAVTQRSETIPDVDSFLINFDDSPQTYPRLPEAESIYCFYPPPPTGQADFRTRHVITFLTSWKRKPRRVVLISTTSVYGDCEGEWVDESRSPNPQTDRAKRRLDAEKQWEQWTNEVGCELLTLRVAGIYGPDKLPKARLSRGEPMPRASESPFSNRIHIEDLVDVCLAAMHRGIPGLYNVSDGHPSTMVDYFHQVADVLGMPRLPEVSMNEAQQKMSPAMRSYLSESRRLMNDKLLGQLGITLKYPNLKTGLAACVKGSYRAV